MQNEAETNLDVVFLRAKVQRKMWKRPRRVSACSSRVNYAEDSSSDDCENKFNAGAVSGSDGKDVMSEEKSERTRPHRLQQKPRKPPNRLSKPANKRCTAPISKVGALQRAFSKASRISTIPTTQGVVKGEGIRSKRRRGSLGTGGAAASSKISDSTSERRKGARSSRRVQISYKEASESDSDDRITDECNEPLDNASSGNDANPQLSCGSERTRSTNRINGDTDPDLDEGVAPRRVDKVRTVHM